jgi:TRAP-type C4-dicarboxylate transport system substrate-binding protein
LDSATFAKLSEPHKKAIHDSAKIHFPVLLEKTRESNKDSRRVLETRGNQFLEVEQQTLNVLREKSEETVNHLIPGTLSKDIYGQLVELRSEFRNKTTAEKAGD